MAQEEMIATKEVKLGTRLQIRKKDGHLEPYQTNKLQRALAKALQSVKQEAEAWHIAKHLTAETEEANYLAFKGSSNQRIVDVPASLEANEALLWEPKV